MAFSARHLASAMPLAIKSVRHARGWLRGLPAGTAPTSRVLVRRQPFVTATQPCWVYSSVPAMDTDSETRRARREARRAMRSGDVKDVGSSGEPAAPAGDATGAAPAKKVGAIEKVKGLWKQYGMVALGVYGTLWVVPAGVAFGALSAFDNFGVDPNALFEWAGWEYRTTSLEPWHVSGLMALLCADVMEPVRIMLTVAATPRVAKALRKRRDSPPSDDGESKSQ